VETELRDRMEGASQEKLGRKYTFPKRVGVVFLERRKRELQEEPLYEDPRFWIIKRSELSLDFDQDACAFLLLQMNQYQSIFEFQVVALQVLVPKKKDKKKDKETQIAASDTKTKDKETQIAASDTKTKDKETQEMVLEDFIPKKKDKEKLFEWLDKFVEKRSDLNINYWMGITSELMQDHKNWHFEGMAAKETKSHRILWTITSRKWEENRSPPSLFEYLLATVFRCALQSLSNELELEDKEIKELKFLRAKLHKVTRGCVFDFTHRRASVSIFKLCFGCQKKLRMLEKLIRDKGNNWDVNLVHDVKTILSKEWIGSPEKRDSPLFNLKKMYKYDVDRNSGFNKGYLEKFRDSIYDKSAEWIVSGIIGAIITGAIAIVFKLIG
jgi:hypothetical protein